MRARAGRTLAATAALRDHDICVDDTERRPRAKPCSHAADKTLADLDLGDAGVAEAVWRAQRIADYDIPLLIQGETGTGKEVFARAFHCNSSRRDGPFVAVNCAAIPATLIEVELFGYVAGAYTGARCQGASGKLREAHGGMLFLDEIGDMPVGLQAVLLRPAAGPEQADRLVVGDANTRGQRKNMFEGSARQGRRVLGPVGCSAPRK